MYAHKPHTLRNENETIANNNHFAIAHTRCSCIPHVRLTLLFRHSFIFLSIALSLSLWLSLNNVRFPKLLPFDYFYLKHTHTHTLSPYGFESMLMSRRLYCKHEPDWSPNRSKPDFLSSNVFCSLNLCRLIGSFEFTMGLLPYTMWNFHYCYGASTNHMIGLCDWTGSTNYIAIYGRDDQRHCAYYKEMRKFIIRTVE